MAIFINKVITTLTYIVFTIFSYYKPIGFFLLVNNTK